MNLHPTNRIHPTATIDIDVEIGKGNVIGPYCYIGPNVKIGDNNKFSGYCSVGMPAEHRDYFSKYGTVVIGSNNTIREFTTINSSTTRTTKMGDNCTMLRGSHLSHDTILEDNVTLSCNVLVGGESLVMKGANLGLGSITHQRTIIAPYAMLGMGCIVTKKSFIEPFTIYVGNPAKILKQNKVAIERAGLDDLAISHLVGAWMKYCDEFKSR